MKNRKKKVYVAMSADILHSGHINILKKASKLGEVIVGLLTDDAINSYKKKPLLNYEERYAVIKSIIFVNKIVSQRTLDYTKNLKKIKPHFVVHGNDWKKGVQKKIRSKVIETISSWNGKLIEPKYTAKISSSIIKKKIEKFIS